MQLTNGVKVFNILNLMTFTTFQIIRVIGGCLELKLSSLVSKNKNGGEIKMLFWIAELHLKIMAHFKF